VSLLDELGYSRVSHFPGGMQEWETAALRIQQGAPISTEVLLKPQRPIRIRRDRWGAFVDLFERRTTADLVWIWMGTIALWALLYWSLTLAGVGGLREGDDMIGGGRSGFWTALYFSFGAATSIALGDVVPTGPVRILAIVEAVVGLLVFGAMVSKLVSRRQEQVVAEIHRLAYEDVSSACRRICTWCSPSCRASRSCAGRPPCRPSRSARAPTAPRGCVSPSSARSTGCCIVRRSSPKK
jgi:hypothetical protein